MIPNYMTDRAQALSFSIEESQSGWCPVEPGLSACEGEFDFAACAEDCVCFSCGPYFVRSRWLWQRRRFPPAKDLPNLST